MSDSLLLKLARESIEEVLEARRTLNLHALKTAHPELQEKVATAITLWSGEKVRSHYCSLYPEKALLDDLVYNAKVAAFEMPEFPPISTAEYLHVSLQVSLLSPPKPIDATDEIIPKHHGVIMKHQDREAYLFPDAWGEHSPQRVLEDLQKVLQLPHPGALYLFEIQSVKDSPKLSKASLIK